MQPQTYGQSSVYGQPGTFNYGAANPSFTAGSLGAIPQPNLYNSVKLEGQVDNSGQQSLVDMHNQSGLNGAVGASQLPGIQSTRKYNTFSS